MPSSITRHFRWLGVCLSAIMVILALVAQPAAAKTKAKMPFNSGSLPHTTHTGPLHHVALPHAKKHAAAISPATAACATPQLTMQLLVIAADGSEADLPAIQSALDYLGAPYVVYEAAQNLNGLTPAVLGNGCQGNYAGVILTTSDLAYYNGTSWVSALSPDEWNTLWTYEANLGVREVSWFTYPTADYGFQPPSGALDTTNNPITAKLTASGKSTFNYVNPSANIPIQYAYTYLAKPLTDGSSVTLVQDNQGDSLGVVHTTADGRTVLALTYDSNQYLMHDLILSYGYLNWVSNGLFIGEHRMYLSPQVDDVFIDDDEWVPTTPCGTPVDQTGYTYRITGTDLQAVVNWQSGERILPASGNLKLTLVFNGEGTTGEYSPDTLTPFAVSNRGQFFWVNHTYSHENLDNVSYTEAVSQIIQNNQIAAKYSFPNYSTHDMVTPDISGLTNPQFLQAAHDKGIHNLVSDTSVAGYNNPAPNVGIYNSYQPSILEIPRHPTNLFYNVTTPDELAAEYNCLYHSFWGRDLSYQEILDIESQTLLSYLLRGDMDPLMFHEANLRAYDGLHTLLGDLLDETLTKYRAYFKPALLFYTMDTLGHKMASFMQYTSAGVTATYTPGVSITLTAQHAATVPVTGLHTSNSTYYSNQYITYVTLSAGQTVTFPLT